MSENMADRLGDWSPEELEQAGEQVLATIRDYLTNVGEMPVLTDIARASPGGWPSTGASR